MAIISFPIVVLLVVSGYYFRETGVPITTDFSYDLFGNITSNATPDFAFVASENLLIWLCLYSFVFLLCYVKPQRDLLRPFKFNPNYPAVALMVKEFFRSFRGVLICSVFEYFMNYLVSNGYQQLFESPATEASLTQMIVVPFLLYMWSDFHFYWTHRMLHGKWFYANVHKYHHESFNPNPWSGLAMHPLESAIYFTSPLIVGLAGFPTWYYRMLFKALLIFPLEGHAGFGSWAIENSHNHYIHHSKFNWNYGSSPLFDHLFGTNYKNSCSAGSKGKPMSVGKTEREKAMEAEAKQQAEMVGASINGEYKGGSVGSQEGIPHRD